MYQQKETEIKTVATLSRRLVSIQNAKPTAHFLVVKKPTTTTKRSYLQHEQKHVIMSVETSGSLGVTRFPKNVAFFHRPDKTTLVD